MKPNLVYKISDYPLIWTGLGSKNWEKLANNTSKSAYLLAHTMWFFGFSSIIHYWKKRKELNRRNIKLILLLNSKQELRIARFFGFSSILANHNIQACEHEFSVIMDIEKKYDAVYVAAAKKYKRLHLASLIQELFIVTYFWPDKRNSKGEWDLHSFEPRIQHANFNRFRIDRSEVKQIINQSYCGLALSKKEGAMFASIEYLLCGVPVVSTKSKGGRDFFFTSSNSLICRDSANAVLEAVRIVKARECNPMNIRKTTLQLMNDERYKLLNFVSNLVILNGCEPMDKELMYFNLWGNPAGISNSRYI